MTPRALRPAGMLTLGFLAFCACEGDGGKTAAQPPRPVAPVVTVDVIRSFPHDTSAYTQGLIWHGGFLYESTGRTGQSSLRKVQLDSGKVLRKLDIAAPTFAEGLALLGGRLYQLTWQDQVGFIYELDTFRRVGTFPYENEGWGLTTDGRALILSDGSNQLRFLDPQAGYRELRKLSVMDGTEYVNDLNELEWVKGEVWANVWHTNRIARIDPRTGQVKGWVDMTGVMAPQQDPEAVMNGIAYDAEHDRLFVTGKLWPTLFEIRVPGVAGGGQARPAETSAPARP